MRIKAVAARWAVAGSSVLVFCLGLMLEAIAQPLDRPLPLISLAQNLNSPEKIASYIWHNFAFESDRRLFGKDEYIQSADELLKNRRGDCEDFARFAYEILKLNGKRPMILNLYGEKSAHSVCLFKEKGSYHVIDGANVHRLDTDKLNEVTAFLNPHWQKAVLMTTHQKIASLAKPSRR